MFNVLNSTFVNGFVFNHTGSPDYTLNPETANAAALYDPSRFYQPRRIEFGISLRRINYEKNKLIKYSSCFRSFSKSIKLNLSGSTICQ